MKTRDLITIIVCVLLGGTCVFAQVSRGKLLPEDNVPNVEFPVILNGTKTSAKLSDFRGKVVLLDYWNIWCSSCIESFPKLDSLQALFKDDLVILPVSFLHTKETIADFLDKRNNWGKSVNLSFAVFESTKVPLFQLFPVPLYPSYIWIDTDGRFIQSSDANAVTVDNIKNAINGNGITGKTRNYQVEFDSKIPLLTNNNGGPDSTFIYRSLITGYIDSIQSRSLDKYQSESSTRIFTANKTILELIRLSLYGYNFDPFNQYVVLEDVDTAKFIHTEPPSGYEKWFEKNAYCYDLTLPADFDKDELSEMMKLDIKRFFRIDFSKENRPMPCYELIRTDTVDRLTSKTDLVPTISNSKELILNHRSLNDFLSFLNTEGAPIMVDATGFTNPVDIRIEKSSVFNLTDINSQLARYGLQLKPTIKEFEIIGVKGR